MKSGTNCLLSRSLPGQGELADDGHSQVRPSLLGPYRIVHHVVGVIVSIVRVADGRRDMRAVIRARLIGASVSA